jgi:predicted acetyltransferase
MKNSFPEYHINWFNAKKIETMLRVAGFRNIYESRYCQSKCSLMRNPRLFDFTVPDVSLYMECQK